MNIVRNTWPDREKFKKLADERQRKEAERIGLPTVFGTAPPLTVSNAKLENIYTTTDHVGAVINLVYNAEYVGNFDPVYITGNASALGFPWYGDYAVGATGYTYCSHTECKYRGGNGTSGSPGAFDYTATFSPITPDRYDLSPLDRPAIVTGGGLELTEVRNVDVNGDGIVNAVGDYYEGLPDFYIPGSEFQVAWNVGSNPLSTSQTYSFSTNNAAIWGQDTYSGCIGKITTEQTFETYEGVFIEYWRITVPFRFRNDGRGWAFAPLNYGNRYLDTSDTSGGSGGTVKNYIDVNGVYGPVFLTSSGTLLNGNGTAIPTAPSVFPAASGMTPAGYQTLTGQAWSGLAVPLNPFS